MCTFLPNLAFQVQDPFIQDKLDWWLTYKITSALEKAKQQFESVKQSINAQLDVFT